MRLHRLRVELEDHPGRLGEVAAALGGIGANILDVDVHGVGNGSRVDELVVDLQVPVDLPAVEHAVASAGGSLVAIVAADAHELRDRVVAGIELVAGPLVRDEPPPAGSVCEIVRELVAADLACVAAPGPVPASDIVRQVRETRTPAQIEAPVKRLPSLGSPTWWLGVPFPCADGEPPVLLLVRRGAWFTYTETARVQAVLRALSGRLGERGIEGSEVVLRDGGRIVLRDLRPADLPAVERMHGRCSSRALHQRYLSAKTPALARLLPGPAGQARPSMIAVAAALGSEIVGYGHACLDAGGGPAELAFLVEDGHQRRGIASALFSELEGRLVTLGVRHAFALTFPENQGMRALLRAVAGPVSSCWDGSLLRMDTVIGEAPPSGGATRPPARPSAGR